MTRPTRSRWLRLCALGAVALVGCGETAGTGGSGGSAGSGGTGGDGPEVVSHYLRVFEFDIEAAPIEGARVCQLDTENCVTSNARGTAVLELPIKQEIAFTVEKDGYGPWLFANVTDESFQEDGTAALATHEQLANFVQPLGIPYPWEKGMVGLQRWPSRAGVRFLPVGPTVDAVGAPFYWDVTTQQYSLDLEATTFSPAVAEYPFAQGGFTEVTPGVHQFEFSGTVGDCTHASWAWPGDAPNRIRIPVIEGYTTYGSMRCDAP